MDDYLMHQIPEPQSKVVNNDPRWLDRFYFTLIGDESTPMLEAGLGAYVNKNAVDAFSLFSKARSGQHSLRTGRPHDGDSLTLTAGPLEFAIVEPLKRWNLACSTEGGVGFDLRFDAVSTPYEAVPLTIAVAGKVVSDHRHYLQFGTVSGWIRDELGDTTEIENARSVRDRSWGTRNAAGAPRRGLVLWSPSAFDDGTLVWFWLLEHEDGRRHSFDGFIERDGVRVGIAGLHHEIEFADGDIEAATVQILTVNGDTHILQYERLDALFLHTAGYSASAGHGDSAHHASAWQAHETAVGSFERTGLIDNKCRVTLDGVVKGTGIFETGLGRHVTYAPQGLGGA